MTHILIDIPVPLPVYMPSCMRCGGECLPSERECFGCQLEMEGMIAEDLEMETE